jgi:hypothetical protein
MDQMLAYTFLDSRKSRWMKFEFLIQISIFRSPGFSRIWLSWQSTVAPTGIQPAKAGTPVRYISELISQRAAAGSGFPGSMQLPR